MPDYFTPFTQGFNFVENVRNRRAVIAEEQRQNRTLEDLRRQQMEQQFATELLRVADENPQAAEQIWNNTPAAVQRSGGPIKFQGRRGKDLIYDTADGPVILDPANMQYRRFKPAEGEDPVRFEQRAASQGSLMDQAIRTLATDPATGQLDPERALQLRREAMSNPSSPENIYFQEALKRHKGDVPAAFADYLGKKAETAGATAAGRERGEMSVQGTQQYQQIQRDVTAAREGGKPLPASAQTAIAQGENVQQQIQEIRSNFDEKFLGPVRGTDAAFEARRRIGSYVGAPLGEKETKFRQSLANISDTLLRLRSGAQINEKEFDRLRSLLPRATDEPKVFNAGLDRFQKELDAALESRKRLATQPRDQQAGPQTRGGSSKTLDAATARTFLERAGGDKDKARKLARDEGYDF